MQENASRKPDREHQPGIGTRGLKAPDVSSDEASQSQRLDQGQGTVAGLGDGPRIQCEFDLREVFCVISLVSS